MGKSVICNTNYTEVRQWITAERQTIVNGNPVIETLDFEKRCNCYIREDDYTRFECVNFNNPKEYVILAEIPNYNIKGTFWNFGNRTMKEVFDTNTETIVEKEETNKTTEVEVAEPVDVAEIEKTEKKERSNKVKPAKVRKPRRNNEQ